MKKKDAMLSVFFCLFLLGGCQKQEGPANKADQDQPSSAMCNEIDKGLQQYMQDWDPEAVDEFNDLVKSCLPKLNMQQRYAWLNASNDIYKNLIDNSSDDVINYLANLNNPNNPISADEMKANYNNFDDDQQYLIDHFKDLYLQEYNTGDDGHDLFRSAKYKIDLFGPYLNKADLAFFEQEYLEEKISNGAVVKDATLTVDFSTLVNWILVWEKYVTNNPNAYFNAQAKEKIKQYQSYLFYGVDNSSVFDPHQNNYINPKAFAAIKTLAKTNTPSGAIAKQYITYVRSNQATWNTIHSQNSDDQDQQLEQRYIQDVSGKFGVTPFQPVETKAPASEAVTTDQESSKQN